MTSFSGQVPVTPGDEAFDRTGSYGPALYVVCAMLAYNAIVFTLLGRYPPGYASGSGSK